MTERKRSTGKTIAFVLGCIAAVIGGLGFLLSSASLLPYITSDPGLVFNSIYPTLIWLVGGILLIGYSRKSESNNE